MYNKRFLPRRGTVLTSWVQKLEGSSWVFPGEGRGEFVNNKNRRATKWLCPLCSLPASPSRSSIGVLGKTSQCCGHKVNGPVGISPFQTRGSVHTFQPVVCSGRSSPEGRSGGHGGRSLCKTYRIGLVYWPATTASAFPRADRDNETRTDPCTLPRLWSPSDASRYFFLVLTTLPDLHFITNCGYHLSSFLLVIWLFYTVQRKCLV